MRRRHSRWSWFTSTSTGRLLAACLSAVLIATLVGSVPATAMPADDPAAPPTTPARHEKAVPGKAVKGHARKADPHQAEAAATTAKLPAPRWPDAGTGTVSVPAATAARAQVGDLPVSLKAARSPKARKATATASTIRVDWYSHKDATRAGFGRGALLRLSGPDDQAPASTDVTVDYSSFAHAYGGDYASRLRLVRLPSCATSIARARSCGPATPLASANDVAHHTVTATADITADGTMLALDAGPSGPAGDFGATALSVSSTWSAGGNSGDFSWSYPMDAPPSINGPAPKLALSYSSSSVDGRTEATNNQPSWLGEGFEYSPGYIERRYKGCSDDMGGTANNSSKTGDMCWGTDNAFLSMDGHAGELIKDDDSGTFRLKNDDGTRVERLTNTTNDDNDNEYWKITTPDGIQYYFGLNRLPGFASGDRETQSVFTEPVFGNNTGEPCHKTTFADSSCQQAWRWNLDYVVDSHGNTMSLWWTKETNKYAANNTSTNTISYTRGGYLTRINYGTRASDAQNYDQHAPARVVFGTDNRCLTDCSTHDEAHWPDTPWDQNCTGDTCSQYGPSFWSTKRLATITTQVWNSSTSAFDDIDRWTLTHSFPNPGDGTRAGMWLSSVTRTGLVGGSKSLPAVSFEWTQMHNRVDPQTGDPTMNWMRMGRINTESGEQISIDYTPQQCIVGQTMPTSAQDNTLRCFPVISTDEAGKLKTDWYHKYLVTSVSEYDELTGNNAKTTRYQYVGNPAWHHDDADGLTPASHRTWAQFRGYSQVNTRVGDEGIQSLTETQFYRGMGGSLTAGVGSAQTDEDAFAGQIRQQTVYDGTEDKPVSRTVNEAWQSAPTATRTIAGSTTYARHLGTKSTYQQTALDAGRGWRTTLTTTSFDSYGMATSVYDHGDTSKAGDERCTTTTYNRNTSKNILNTVGRVLSTALACGTDPTGPDDVISDTRTWFDGQDYGTAPTAGDPTRTEVAKDWNSSGPVYLTTARSTVDSYGRILDQWDVRGAETTTTYLPATGGPVTKVTSTNPLGWTSTTELDERGQSLGGVNINNQRSDNTYDPLGRLTQTWKTPRYKANNDPPSATFDYTIASNGANSVTTNVVNATGGYSTTYAIFDGLLRQVQTQSLADGIDGGRVLTDTVYDSLGRQWKTNGPYYDTAAPSTTLFAPTEWTFPRQTVTDYDRANRPTATITLSKLVEQWRTTTYYGGDYTTVTPPQGGSATRTTTDARGNTTELRQYHGNSPSGDYDTTRYDYNNKDQLTKVTDPSGNTWTSLYNLAGQQVASSDPDHGSVTTTYTDAGDAESTTDARGVTLKYTYDLLGRKTGEYSGQVSDDTKLATWTYDTAKIGPGKGQLAASDRYVDGADYKISYRVYSPSGMPAAVDYVIPASEKGLAGTYSYGYSFNADGSPKQTNYPKLADLPSESVALTYDPTTGLPIKLKSGTTSIPGYVTNTTYTAYGQPETTTYQGGAQKYLQQTRLYDDATGRLTDAKTVRETAPTIVSDVHYGYDPAGNILSTADTITGDTQCFTYDYLQRLTEAWTPDASSTCDSQPSTSTLGGPAPYWQSYRYDPSGNRTQLVNHASLTTVGQASTTNYTYPAAGGAQPHTLTSATTTTDSASDIVGTYTYDPAGNTLTRPGASAEQTLSWDSENHLASLTEGSDAASYLYDADGTRLIARDKTGSTLYLPNQELHYDPATDTTTGTRYYTYGNQSIAVRTHDGLTWLVSDQQGTAVAQIPDAAGQEPVWRRQDPFGNLRGAQATSWTGSRGFVGGTLDPTGLTHLGAREYDAGTGRFLSDDPITDTSNPQQLNGYAYANNSPITQSDPAGTMAAAITDEGTPCTNCTYDPPAPPKPQPKKCGFFDVGCHVSHAWHATVHWAQKHPTLVSTVVSVAVGIGCEAAIGVTGVGAVACGAVAGAVASAVSYGLTCSAAHNCNVKDLAVETAVGAVTGAVGGALGVAAGAGSKLVVGAAKNLMRKAVTRGAEKAADDVAESGASRAASCVIPHSFIGTTPVLMANGDSKPIDQIQPGDEVANNQHGDTTLRRHRVDKVIVTRTDRHYVELTLDTPTGQAHLTTTTHHPFWDVTTDAWTQAADLRHGDKLQTPTGTVHIRTIRIYTATRITYDLTIHGLHTYYVLAATTPVLVHNCGGEPSDELLDLADANIGQTNVASEVVAQDGTRGLGVSARRGLDEMTPQVRTAVQATGHHGGCAEIGALCDIESQGASIVGARSIAVKVMGGDQGFPPEVHGEVVPHCKFCSALFRHLEGGEL